MTKLSARSGRLPRLVESSQRWCAKPSSNSHVVKTARASWLRWSASTPTLETAPRKRASVASWKPYVQRGEVFRLRAPKDPRGHEQAGARFGVVVQADELLGLSTIIVAPTSTRALPATFRPEVEIEGRTSRVLVEQMGAVDPSRLGESRGLLSFDELRAVDRAIALVVGLDV